MDVVKLYKDSDFANAVVPEGTLLVFFSVNDSGKVVRRYKDSNGNFGDM